MPSKRDVELAGKRQLWQQRVDQWKQSRLTQVEYCRRNNLNPRKFLYWKMRFEPKCKISATLVELPVKVVPQPARPASSPLCLVMDDRYRIEIAPGFDVASLDQLIRVLDRK